MRCWIFVFLVVTVWGMASADPKSEFQAWKTKYEKSYKDDETVRYSIWLRSRETVIRHNTRFKAGKETYDMELNKYADWTKEELRGLLSCPEGANIKRTREGRSARNSSAARSARSAPDSINLRDKNYVTYVKNQGDYGTCYAFAAVGAVEGLHAKETGKLVSLSAQQVIDCDQGCDGGFPDLAFKYIIRAGGIESQNTYRYIGQKGTCKFDKSRIVSTIGGYHRVARGDEGALKGAVATQPVAAAIEVTESFQGYSSGIFQDDCHGNLNHAVLVVGYGTSLEGQDYWLIKNSWGIGWGENGYMKLIRNSDKNCGIASYAFYPTSAAKRAGSQVLIFVVLGTVFSIWAPF